MQKKCEHCKYWKKDFGIHCVNGWSGMDKDNGHCHYEIKTIYKNAEDFCSHFILSPENQ